MNCHDIFLGIKFFILLIILIIPACVLGLREKRIAPYGFIISLFFLSQLFLKNKIELLFFILFILLQTLITYMFLHQRKQKKSQELFYTAICLSIFPLLGYKVCTVFDSSLFGFLGISYVTFKSVQVIIEIHDGIIKEITLFDYLYFVLFFPTFTSGPIDRSRRFTTDAHNILPKKEYISLLSTGLTYIIIGAIYELVIGALFLKWQTQLVVPDMVVMKQITYIFKHVYCYGLYLFFNFAGYSYMAIGTSYCLGIKTPKNFDKPFVSIDIKEFWNRWHITLSHWLRDFVFTRFVMTATRKKLFKSRLSCANIGYIINMLIMGFWHGITMNYILYGLYHGLLLAATDTYQKKSKFYKKNKNKKTYKLLFWFITFNLVMLGFLIFKGNI